MPPHRTVFFYGAPFTAAQSNSRLVMIFPSRFSGQSRVKEEFCGRKCAPGWAAYARARERDVDEHERTVPDRKDGSSQTEYTFSAQELGLNTDGTNISASTQGRRTTNLEKKQLSMLIFQKNQNFWALAFSIERLRKQTHETCPRRRRKSYIKLDPVAMPFETANFKILPYRL